MTAVDPATRDALSEKRHVMNEVDAPQCPARHLAFGRCCYALHDGDEHWIEDRFTPGRGVTFCRKVTDEQKAEAYAEWEANR